MINKDLNESTIKGKIIDLTKNDDNAKRVLRIIDNSLSLYDFKQTDVNISYVLMCLGLNNLINLMDYPLIKTIADFVRNDQNLDKIESKDNISLEGTKEHSKLFKWQMFNRKYKMNLSMAEYNYYYIRGY